MSQAEALLRNLTENVPIHTHVVADQDSYFVINPDTREIENTSRTKNVLMQHDHNSEKFTFELARYVEGHDMILCNRVRVHFNNIDGATGEENADVAELYDLAVDPDDESKVLCSWTITRQATQLVGTLNFLVQYECIDDTGNSVYEWHTDIYTDVEVKKGRNNAEQAIIEYSNILEQWYQRIFGTGDAVVSNIALEGEKQVAAVAAAGIAQKEAVALKGEATLATIPEDYTTTYNMAKEALRRKANAIELDAEGEAISVNNSSDAYLLGLNVYGRTTQYGEPTPETPVDLVSVENLIIKIRGKNLLDINETLTFTQYTDIDVDIPAGVYTLSYDSIDTDYGVGPTVGFSANNVWFELKSSGLKNTVTLTKAETKLLFYSDGSDYNWSAGKAATINGLMLSVDNGDYEPYKPVQTLAINHTLRGIPVTSGGNYTDSDGQQWVCDEVDLERGVFIKRTNSLTLTGENDWHTYTYNDMYFGLSIPEILDEHCTRNPGMSNQFTKFENHKDNCVWVGVTNTTLYVINKEWYDKGVDAWKVHLNEHPLQIIYVRTTPIETPLTAEEIAAFKALRTNYPNTTILNDAGAWMSVKYNADTKTYVENPKILKLTDSSTGLVYELKIVDGNLTVVQV